MRKKDIKIGNYYYCVNSIYSLYSRNFPHKSLVEKFKMTDSILIMKPQDIFVSYKSAKLKAIEILDKFYANQIRKLK